MENATDDLIEIQSEEPTIEREYSPYTYIYPKNTAKQHLVFILHGVGQNATVLENTVQNKLKACLEQLMPLKDQIDSSIHIRMIDWKSSIFDDIATNLDFLTEHSLKTVDFKRLLSRTHDFLYYSDSNKKHKILLDIVTQMNDYYLKCVSEAETKVTVLAHSLGSVIFHDVLALMKVESKSGLYKGLDNSFEAKRKFDAHYVIRTDCDIPPLKFCVSNLFNLGSPLSLFLTIKNEGKCEIEEWNLVGRFFNILHPFDPVAYRIEPLLREEKAECAKIPHWDGKKNRFFYTLASILTCTVEKEAEESYFTRVDYELQEEAKHKFFKLLGNLTSHQDYWNNLDMMAFILDNIED